MLGEIQRRLLDALLSGEILPGASGPLWFPDLSFVLRHPAVALLSDNLAEDLSVEQLARPVRIVSLDTLQREAHLAGDIAYLRFHPAETEGDMTRLTLEARIVPRDPALHPLGLGGLQIRFRRVGDHWAVAEEPIYFAI